MDTIKKTIKLPCYGIEVQIEKNDKGDTSGTVCSTLKEDLGMTKSKFKTAIDIIESMVLAHACAGINISSPDYIEGIETTVDAIANNL